MIEYNNYAVTYFLDITRSQGSIWALDYTKMEWINLRITLSDKVPQGINRLVINPNGIGYLLGQTSELNSEEVQILQFDIGVSYFDCGINIEIKYEINETKNPLASKPAMKIFRLIQSYFLSLLGSMQSRCLMEF